MADPIRTNTARSTQSHTPIVDVAIAVVVDNLSDQNVRNNTPDDTPAVTHRPRHARRVLISRRKAEQVLGGYWELPGGKVEPNETPAQAVVRELKEEVGIDATPHHALPTVEHRYDHAHIRLHPFICEHTAGTPSPIEVDAVRWVTPDQLADHRFPDASLPVLAAFHDWLNTPNTATPTATPTT